MSSRGGQQPSHLHVVRQLSGRLSGVVPQRRVQAVVSPSVITWRPAARPPPRCPSAVWPSVRPSVRCGPAATRPGRGVTECHHVAASSPATSTLSVSCPAVCPVWSRSDASRPWCHRVSSRGGQQPGHLHVVRQLSGCLSGVVPQLRVQAVVSLSVTECHHVAASSPASSMLSVSCPAICPAWSRNDASRPWCHRVSPSVITWRPAARPAPRYPSAVRPSVRRGPAATRPGRGVTECHHVAASSPASSTLSVSCPAVCPAWSRSDVSRPWCHRVSLSVTECHHVAASSPATSTLSVSCPTVCPAWSRSDASRPWWVSLSVTECHRVSPSVTECH